ncbi:hypothetical protein [Nodosilinea nodulosa]|uniref:hypothetical protein n=1 Tax=Nodosilinea nodulosa TaxID=416001 RepID=UPI0002D3C831|nr:hypothetical protein [Nodosilinea nodulosa]
MLVGVAAVGKRQRLSESIFPPLLKRVTRALQRKVSPGTTVVFVESERQFNYGGQPRRETETRYYIASF